jgi:hypothetical protein
MASEDFDISRLTERQQIAYFAAQSSTNKENALRSSPFRIDRILADSTTNAPSKCTPSPGWKTKSTRGSVHLTSQLVQSSPVKANLPSHTICKWAEIHSDLVGGAHLSSFGSELYIEQDSDDVAIYPSAFSSENPTFVSQKYGHLTPELGIFLSSVDDVRQVKRSLVKLHSIP